MGQRQLCCHAPSVPHAGAGRAAGGVATQQADSSLSKLIRGRQVACAVCEGGVLECLVMYPDFPLSVSSEELYPFFSLQDAASSSSLTGTDAGSSSLVHLLEVSDSIKDMPFSTLLSPQIAEYHPRIAEH